MKAKDEVHLHTYQGISFMIVIVDGKTVAQRVAGVKQVHVRYDSPLGKFVIHTTLTGTRMALIGDWQGYLCNLCLESYAKAKDRRQQDLSTGKAKR